MTDPQTLLTQAQCYMCLGVSMSEALELALLAQIAGGANDLWPAGTLFYRALLSQSGTAVPTATVLVNTTGFDFAYSRAGGGNYTATPTGGNLLVQGKTAVRLSIGSDNTAFQSLGIGVANVTVAGAVHIVTTTITGGLGFDNVLGNTLFEISILK